MGELMDKIKGRTKEIAGRFTGNRQLEREGKGEEIKGEVKGGFEEIKQGVKSTIRQSQDPATRQ